MKWGNWVVVGWSLLAGGCSVTLDVYSIVGDSDVYTGTTTGYAESGTMNISDSKGTNCIGQRAGTMAAGHGMLNCSDGTRAQIQYTTLSMMSGYGYGTTSDGRSIRFTYGLSREEGAKYLGQQPVQAAAATPGTPAPPTKTKGTGTGFYITRQGHVLTAAHVIDKCPTVMVSRPGGSSAAAAVVATDSQNDLAVLMGAPPQGVASFRTARAVRPGESVVAYGFPLTGTLSSGGTVTSGNVNALSGLGDDTRYLQISAPVQPGNSGGPLLDSTGAVVGVVTSQINAVRVARSTGSVPQNVNFAIKVDVVKTFLDTRGIAIEAAASGRELGTPDIGERARAFSVLVECKN